jgi:DNA-binding Xre family transcriptional regulator
LANCPEFGALTLSRTRDYDAQAMAVHRKRKRELTDEILRPYWAKEIERLADEAGMDAGTLRRLEKGEAPVREDYVFGICRFLQTDVGDLLRRVMAAYEAAQKAKESPLSEDDPIRELVEKIRDRHEARARSDREYLEACLDLLRFLSLQMKGPSRH